MPTINQLDPSRLNGLRRRFIAILRKGYTNFLQRTIKELSSIFHSSNQTTVNESYTYDTNPNKVKRFREYLRRSLDSNLSGDEIIQKAIDDAYNKGTARTYRDIRKKRTKVQPQVPFTQTSASEEIDIDKHDEGNYVKMRRSSKATVEKVKLLTSRTFHELDGINQRMGAHISRTLADGLIHGWTIKRIAKAITSQVNITFQRAVTIAKTELIRAHAEGQLDTLQHMGENRFGVLVEFQSTDDDRVCPKCSSLSNKRFTIDDARGVIPVHSNCRCAWVPLREDT